MRSAFSFVALLVSLSVAGPAQGQSAGDVRAVIDQLFDGMRAGDSTVVRGVMHPDAHFQTVVVQDGRPVLHTGSVDAFVEAVGSPHDDVWDERIWDVEIRVDGHLAQAWTPYAFFLGDTFSHCGVNAFQFFHDGEDWKVIRITDTRRQEGCDLPADL